MALQLNSVPEDASGIDVGNSVHGSSQLGSPVQDLDTIRERHSGYHSDSDSDHDSEVTGELSLFARDSMLMLFEKVEMQAGYWAEYCCLAVIPAQTSTLSPALLQI